MIEVVTSNWFNPQGAVVSHVPFRRGMTVRDVLPEGMAVESTCWARSRGNASGGARAMRTRLQDGDCVFFMSFPGEDVIDFTLSLYQAILFGGLKLLVGEPPGPRTPKVNSSPGYSWDGVTTDFRSAGLPVPILYGTYRVGGSVVAQYVEVRDEGDGPIAILHLLLLLCSGRVDNIGGYSSEADDLTGDALPEGMQVQGNDARSYDGVTVSLRLGTQDQSPLPNFTSVPQVFQVQLPIDQVSNKGTSGTPPVTDWSDPASWVMPSGNSADRLTCTFGFEDGLFRFDNDGDLLKEKVDIQIRYRYVDAVGAPDSEWVYLPSALTGVEDDFYRLEAKVLKAHEQQIAFDLLDPDSIEPIVAVAPVAMEFIRANSDWGRIDQALIDLNDVSGGFGVGDEPDEFTFWWVGAMRGHGNFNPIWHWGDWDEDESTPSVEGIVVMTRQTQSGEEPNSVVEVWIGDTISDSDRTDVITTTELIEDDAGGEFFPHSIAVTYRKNAVGGQNRIRIYVDGALERELLTDNVMQIGPGSGGSGPRWNTMPRKAGGLGAYHGDYRHDENWFSTRELSSAEIAAQHAQGNWSTKVDESLPTNTADSSILFGAAMDGGTTQTAVFGAVQDGTPSAHMDVTGAPDSVEGYVGAALTTGTILRGRVQVQWQRLDKEKDQANAKDIVTIARVTGWTDELLSYPRSALADVAIQATDQLNTSEPSITFLVTGRRVKVWDGVSDPNAPAFIEVPAKYPADALPDLALDRRDGLGDSFDDVTLINWPEFKAWRDWNAEPVYDQRGRGTCVQLSHALVSSQRRITARCTDPVPANWTVGRSVKLGRLVPGAFPYPSDIELTIVSITPVGDDVHTDVVMDWGEGEPLPWKNLVPSADTFDIGGGTWVNDTDTVTVLALADPVMFPPHMPEQPRAARLRFSGNEASMSVDLASVLTSGEQYTVQVVAKVADESGTAPLRVDFDGEQRDYTIADTGEEGAWTTITFVSTYTATSTLLRIIKGDGASEPDRDLGVAQVAVWEGNVASNTPVFLYEPPTPFTASNSLLYSNDLGDTAQWIATGSDAPELVEKNAKRTHPLPFKVPGAPAVWRFSPTGGTSSALRNSNISASNGQRFRVVMMAKVTDGQGDVEYNIDIGDTSGAGVGTGLQTLPDDGEYHTLAHEVTAGLDDWFDFNVRRGPRLVAVAAVMVKSGTVYAAFDSQEAICEVMGVEPRHEIALYLGERGFGGWDALNVIASVGRAAPARVGSQLGVAFDHVQEPVAWFSPANIIIDTLTQQHLSRRGRANSALGEIQDKDQDYARDPVQHDHASLSNGSGDGYVYRESYDLLGCTSRSQAIRELDVILELSQRVLTFVEFETWIQALHVRAGDVIVVAHPTMRQHQGCKVYETSADGSYVTVDTDILVNRRNLLGHTTDLTNLASWELAASGNEPVITAEAAEVPSSLGGGVHAFEVAFPDGSVTPTWFEQYRGFHGVGQQMTFIIWAATVTGSTSDIQFALFTQSESIDVSTVALTTEWQRIVMSGTPTIDEDEVGVRVRNMGGAKSVYFTHPRLIRGADDGVDATFMEANPGKVERLYVAIAKGDGTMTVAEAKPDAAGEFLEGERIELVSELPNAPLAGLPMLIGPGTAVGRTFRVREIDLADGLRRRIRGSLYDPDAYRDPDDFEDFEDPTATDPTDEALSISPFKKGPPLAPEQLSLDEEAWEDAEHGTRERGLLVSWRHRRATVHRVAGSSVYVRDLTETDTDDDGATTQSEGLWELAAQVRGTQQFAALRGYRFRTGHVYEVMVQPFAADGLAASRGKLPTQRRTFGGHFPRLDAPPAGRVDLLAEEATYQLDEPTSHRGQVVEIVRGEGFVNAPVGRIPAGGRTLGPTSDWVYLPESALGRRNPRLLARFVGASNARSEFAEITDAIDPSSLPAVLTEASVEDNGWATDGTLSELETITATGGNPAAPDSLHFAAASSELEATYTLDTINLTRVRRVHVSLGLEGYQWDPTALEELPGFLSRRGAFWTLGQGSYDPTDIRYGRVQVIPEIRVSRSGAPSGDWRRYTPGVYVGAQFDLRVRLVRPDADWDAEITRLAYALRPLSATVDFDGGDDDP